jgi:hypothetical protein
MPMTRELEAKILAAILKFEPQRENDDSTTAFTAPCRSVEPDDGLGPFLFSDAMAEDETTDADAPATKPTRVRKPNIKTLVKEAQRAGLTVKGAAIYTDRVEITFGQPDATKADVEIDTPDGLRRLI